MYDDYYISNNLRYFRKLNHLSQDDLSDLTGISQNHISTVEQGTCNVSIKNALILSDVLNVDVSSLFLLRKDFKHET